MTFSFILNPWLLLPVSSDWMKLCFYSSYLNPWKIPKVKFTPCRILRRVTLVFPCLCGLMLWWYGDAIEYFISDHWSFINFLLPFPLNITTGSVWTSGLSHPGWTCSDNSKTRGNHWESQTWDRTPTARKMRRDERCMCLHGWWLPSKDFQKCVHPDRQRDFPQTLRRWRQDNQK